MIGITAIILTKNEEDMLPGCLQKLQWVDDLLVIDGGSTDRTIDIAHAKKVRVMHRTFTTFADARNVGAKECTSEWIFYVDADERVSNELKTEILKICSLREDIRPLQEDRVQDDKYQGYQIPRKNILLGKWHQHGGWYPDYQLRLIRRQALKEWRGDIHESALIDGVVGTLQEPLVHLTHRSIKDGLLKSAEWSGIEASIRFKSGHPPVRKLGVVRMTVGEFLRGYIFLSGWKDGMEGFLVAMIQAFNQFLIYARLWELQRKESLEDTYKKYESH